MSSITLNRLKGPYIVFFVVMSFLSGSAVFGNDKIREVYNLASLGDKSSNVYVHLYYGKKSADTASKEWQNLLGFLYKNGLEALEYFDGNRYRVMVGPFEKENAGIWKNKISNYQSDAFFVINTEEIYTISDLNIGGWEKKGVFAPPKKETVPLVGGSSWYNDMYSVISLGYGGFTDSCNDGYQTCFDQTKALGIGVGYFFNPYFVEIGYEMLGSVRATYVNDVVDNSIDIYRLMPGYRHEIASDVSAQVKAGVFISKENKISATAPENETKYSVGPGIGLDVYYKWEYGLSLGIGYSAYFGLDRSDFSALSVSLAKTW